jgi:hypothetical protein
MANIPTNCGDIDPTKMIIATEDFIYNHTDTLGEAVIESKTIPYFHQTICQLAYNIPLKTSWVLVIEAENKSNLLNNITNLRTYEQGAWNVRQSAGLIVDKALDNTVGCIFAQGIILPGENIGIDYAGITEENSKRGFINAPFIKGRSNFEPLEVGFLETNNSFVDTFLRPWSIVVAHKGLIATNNESSIKATIKLHQLARNGKDDKGALIRKTFIFENCAPINVSNESLDYAPSTDFPKMQAKFAYSRYYIQSSAIR